MTTRRWTDDGTTWFAISGVGPELTAPAEHVLMDYQRNGDEWRRGYPADTPGLDICWHNFASYAELMLRQAARLQPVPWRETRHELCRRTSGRESSWWLAGSTALAVRGARIEPGDIDLVCSGDGALGLGAIFADAIIEPVVHDASSPISDYWGRAFLGCPARMDRCSQGWRRLPFAVRLRARRRVPARDRDMGRLAAAGTPAGFATCREPAPGTHQPRGTHRRDTQSIGTV